MQSPSMSPSTKVHLAMPIMTPKCGQSEFAENQSEALPPRRSTTQILLDPNNKKLLEFQLIWFFANLIMYGVGMAMVETFLFVYLERSFEPPATKFLLGLTVAVMCLFELPVFTYFDRALDYLREQDILNCCHLFFALRCLLYISIPRGHVWLVLLVEPLHGITFAAMWCAAVRYASNNAPKGLETTMQALCNGLYQQLGFSIGSIFWGRTIEQRGFDFSYIMAAVTILSWGAIWKLGWMWYGKRHPELHDLRAQLLK